MFRATSFTFLGYKINKKSSNVTFTYKVKFKSGVVHTFTDKILLEHVPKDAWDKIPPQILKNTLEALLLMLGINYWCVFPTQNIRIAGFTLTKEQADFWNSMYLNGLGEFFYEMRMDFHGLIDFPYEQNKTAKQPVAHPRRERALVLNGAGKDSILSAEILKESNIPFDYFAFDPTPAHKKIGALIGARTVRVSRKRDWLMEFISGLKMVSSSYPSVSTFTFVAALLAELLDYGTIVFSNERSADIGNFIYLGLPVNHQWCKSSEAEKMTNDYIQRYITPDIKSMSLLRTYSELDIVRRFSAHTKYLDHVTSCNMYFWLPKIQQYFTRKSYWCTRCPKCVFLFACFSAFLPKEKVLSMFGNNLYEDKKLLPLFRSILGIEGFKPLDCVGEPEEMILAMHYADESGQYKDTEAIKIFREHFKDFDFKSAEKKVFTT
ncbi:MAG: hypothetical protein ACK4FA_02580 [Candidatus Paceibacteria bacterium]